MSDPHIKKILPLALSIQVALIVKSAKPSLFTSPIPETLVTNRAFSFDVCILNEPGKEPPEIVN